MGSFLHGLAVLGPWRKTVSLEQPVCILYAIIIRFANKWYYAIFALLLYTHERQMVVAFSLFVFYFMFFTFSRDDFHGWSIKWNGRNVNEKWHDAIYFFFVIFCSMNKTILLYLLVRWSYVYFFGLENFGLVSFLSQKGFLYK